MYCDYYVHVGVPVSREGPCTEIVCRERPPQDSRAGGPEADPAPSLSHTTSECRDNLLPQGATS